MFKKIIWETEGGKSPGILNGASSGDLPTFLSRVSEIGELFCFYVGEAANGSKSPSGVLGNDFLDLLD